MSGTKRFGMLILAVIALLGVVLGLLVINRPGRRPGPVEKIVLAAETVPHASPVWIAENKGYFREQGLEVEIREFASGRTALYTMLAGEGIDMATAAQTPVISRSFGRNDYAIVAGMVYSDRDVKLLGRRDRGVAAPRDLKGKTVGVTSGSSGHFFLGLFLAYHQLQPTDVRIIDLEATRLAEALVEGRVDAIATWEPHIYRAGKVLRDRAALLPSANIYRTDFYFIARKKFIEDHPEALKRFLRAVDKAERFIRTNGREAMEIVRRRLKMNHEELIASWGDFRFDLNLDQSILISLEDEARWAIENELTEATRAPNYLDYLHCEALKAVKPDVMTIAGR